MPPFPIKYTYVYFLLQRHTHTRVHTFRQVNECHCQNLTTVQWALNKTILLHTYLLEHVPSHNFNIYTLTRSVNVCGLLQSLSFCNEIIAVARQ